MSQEKNQEKKEFLWVVGRRLRQVRQMFDFIRQADFGAFLGDFPATTLSRAERGDNLPGPRLLVALVERCGLNLNWLFTGKGEMLASPVPLMARKARIPGIVRHDPNFNRRIKARSAQLAAEGIGPEFQIEGVFEKGYEEIGREDLADLPPAVRSDALPIIGRIAAGPGIDTIEAGQFGPGDAASFLVCGGAPAGAFAVKVDGGSMLPEFESGDIVIADPGQPVQGARPAVVIYVDETGEGVAALKDLSRRGQNFVLASRAKGYKPLILPAKRLLRAYAVFATMKYLKRKKGGVP